MNTEQYIKTRIEFLNKKIHLNAGHNFYCVCDKCRSELLDKIIIVELRASLIGLEEK